MAFVEPQLLDSLRGVHLPQQAPPMTTDTLDNKVQILDDEMKDILERRDHTDRDQVDIYNHLLQRYNAMVDRRVKEPV